MPARDGVPLRADVWRPGGPGRYPVLLVRTPYDKRQASLVNYTHPHWYAAQGFIVAIQDVRGRWASDGDEFTPFEHEQEDGHDAVAWAAALPGSTGRVGMYGGSYVGATQLLAARGAPAELRAIAPGVTSSQYFEGWPYQQGAFALAMNASWASELAADQARRAGDEAAWRLLAAAADTPGTWYPYLPLDEHPPLAAGRFEPYFEWLRHPTYDDYWRRWSIDEDYSSIRAAGLHYGGWWDSFATGTVRNFTGLTAAGRAPQRLLMGPWQHVAWSARTGDVDHGPAAAPEIDQAQLAFFDRHLRDGDGDGEADVRVFVPGLGSWLSESRWPIPGGEEQRLFLSSGGRANSVRGDGRLTLDPPASGQPPDVYVYDPLAPTPSLGGHSCAARARPLDRRRGQRRALRGDRPPRHRLRGPALRGRRGRTIAQPARGHRQGPLPQRHRRGLAARAGCGPPVRDRPGDGRPLLPARAPRPAPGPEQRLPAVGPQPEHGGRAWRGGATGGAGGDPERLPRRPAPLSAPPAGAAAQWMMLSLPSIASDSGSIT
jgi:putative CocE/NonD family hydrolase